MIIGIDLGTTNSLACVYRNGKAELIPNSFGTYLTPSVVSFENNGAVVVGAIAKERLVTNPTDTAASFKRFMGSPKTFCLAGKEFTPQELSAFVLRQLKQDAEQYLGEEVTEAVISVPAYFNNNQRAATLEAGRIAGIHVERLVNEPSAAALASSMLTEEDEQIYLVYDFDSKIAAYFCASHNIDMDSLSPQKQATLIRLAEKAKKELTEKESALLHMEIVGEDKAVILNNEILISCCGTLFDRIETAVKHALRDSGYSVTDINEIILAGGSSKMPVVSYFLQSILGKKPIMIGSPDEVIAQGAGIYAGIKARKEEIRDMLLTDICPFTLGVGIHNPSNLNGHLNMSPIIERNSVLPISKTGIYTNVEDMQRRVKFNIYQGESFDCADNLCLGSVIIEIAPMKAREASIKVIFSYDINGILVVDVEDNLSTNKKQAIFKSEGMNLSPKEIAEKIEALKQYQSDFSGDERDKLLLARGQRLYQELTGINRTRIAEAMQEYEYILSANDKHAKHILRQQITAMFDRFEEFFDVE